MPIRRSGACDQRRRRVLIEENLHGSDADHGDCQAERGDEAPSTVRLPGRRYSGEASADRQRPLTAVVPKRVGTLAVLLLTGACVIAGVQALYGQSGLQAPDHWLRAIAAANVESAGSLATWCSSIFLLAAGIQGLQIYRLRRHRADDYRGRYRVWVWVSPALLGASLVVGTQLHRDLVSVVSLHSDALRAIRPALAWHVVPAMLWLLVALRLVLEVRESRASLAALACATLSYSGAAMTVLMAAGEPCSLPETMLLSSLTMLGHLATFLMVASYSRYVYLDAQGQLEVREKAARKPRQRRAGRRSRSGSESSEDAPAVIPMSQARGGKAAAAPPATAEPSPSSATGSRGRTTADVTAAAGPHEAASGEDENEAAEAGLSKADRRRLKKMKRRELSRKAA